MIDEGLKALLFRGFQLADLLVAALTDEERNKYQSEMQQIAQQLKKIVGYPVN